MVRGSILIADDDALFRAALVRYLESEGFAWSCVPLIDGHGNSKDELLTAVNCLDALIQSHKVLVHCMEGVSRSVLVVSCYLAREKNIDIIEAIAEVTKRRTKARIDPGLMTLLDDGWPFDEPFSDGG